ncbi:TIM barrel protein [candidate division WOR-3 bacterium]|nr:TIM barrel protein [candidate division WOR-3 bacterium]
MKLLFGTAGVPLSATSRTTESGIQKINELGLDCMELEFVRGVKMGSEKAQVVRKIADNLGVQLTVHSPYYINLNSKEPDKVKASKQRILDSAKIGALAGAHSVTFHAAYYMGMNPKEVYQIVKDALLEIMENLNQTNIRIDISPETTGKLSQFGTLEEIISLAKEIPGVKPCIDFAHLHARGGGKPNSYNEFMKIIELVKEELGSFALKDMHLHISGIHYGPKGELNHLTFEDPESKFRYKELLQVLKDENVSGFLICESPTLEIDALLIKNIYRNL